METDLEVSQCMSQMRQPNQARRVHRHKKILPQQCMQTLIKSPGADLVSGARNVDQHKDSKQG